MGSCVSTGNTLFRPAGGHSPPPIFGRRFISWPGSDWRQPQSYFRDMGSIWTIGAVFEGQLRVPRSYQSAFSSYRRKFRSHQAAFICLPLKLLDTQVTTVDHRRGSCSGCSIVHLVIGVRSGSKASGVGRHLGNGCGLYESRGGTGVLALSAAAFPWRSAMGTRPRRDLDKNVRIGATFTIVTRTASRK